MIQTGINYKEILSKHINFHYFVHNNNGDDAKYG